MTQTTVRDWFSSLCRVVQYLVFRVQFCTAKGKPDSLLLLKNVQESMIGTRSLNIIQIYKLIFYNAEFDWIICNLQLQKYDDLIRQVIHVITVQIIGYYNILLLH